MGAGAGGLRVESLCADARGGGLLTERRALVTGGSRGIGGAAARALAKRGWRVTALARD
ncbi:MAG TPA: SDR family NAD(P)-dependent oxidoreductase, partial [Solirubrobacteraceae bacterium]|nr:SDR family NAD(P)-dependent oxidoreductase [Solirubrobacteraceae bacterium]